MTKSGCSAHLSGPVTVMLVMTQCILMRHESGNFVLFYSVFALSYGSGRSVYWTGDLFFAC